MKATKIAWPGNNLPLFRGDLENTKKLNDLVKELKDKYATKHFGEAEIRLHIINTVAERRRNVKKRGFDYEQVHSYI